MVYDVCRKVAENMENEERTAKEVKEYEKNEQNINMCHYMQFLYLYKCNARRGKRE